MTTLTELPAVIHRWPITRRALAVFGVFIAFMLAWPGMVFAQDAEASVKGDEILSLDPGTVRLLIAFVIPFLVGLLVKADWPGYVKGGLDLILNFANAAIIAATVADDGHAAWSQVTLREALLGAAVSLAAYYKVFKPAGLFSGFQPNGTPGKLNTVLIK